MRLYEHEAKRVFAKRGLRVPESLGLLYKGCGELDVPAEVLDGGPVMVKAQVLTGGRGKAGGVAKASTPEELNAAVARILDLRIKGFPVEAVLVERAASYRGACYLGVTTDPRTAGLVLIASAAGGVDIEEVARNRPEAILKLPVAGNPAELPAADAERAGAFLAEGLGEPDLAPALADAASRLFAAFQAHDCKVLEINPLLVTDEGLLAADAKMVIDDNALYRQARLLDELGIRSKRHDVAEPTANERRAAKAGFFYVDLHPEDWKPEPGQVVVGLVPGGAGYGIFSIDEVRNVGDRFFDGRVVPFNFMDSGGGPTLARVAEMFHLLMDDPRVDLVITSRFGGISSCDTFIRGLVRALRERHADGRRVVRVHGRMVGTDLPAARAFLESAMRETPEALARLDITVGNRQIMAEVIKEGLRRHFEEVGA